MNEENSFDFKEEDLVVEETVLLKFRVHLTIKKWFLFGHCPNHLQAFFFKYQTVLQFCEGGVGEYCRTFVTHSQRKRRDHVINRVADNVVFRWRLCRKLLSVLKVH